jgi:large subunit ribosomal protein L7/L12
MTDENKGDKKEEPSSRVQVEGKVEEAVEESKESAEEAKEAAGKAEESAEKAEETSEKVEEVADEAESAAKEATEAAEEVKETTQEAKEEIKEEVKEAAKPAPEKEIKVSGKLADFIKEIEKLTVLELADLVKALEQKFGVSAAPVAVAAPTGGQAAGGEEAAQDEGQTTFNVILADSGANKISVIKAVRGLVPTLGLKEAKDLVDAAPKPVLEGVGKDAANEAKQKLEAAGGKVELQ